MKLRRESLRSRWVRRLGVAVLASAGALALSGASAAGASSSRAASGVTLELKTTSDAAALSFSHLEVIAHVAHRGRAKITTFSVRGGPRITYVHRAILHQGRNRIFEPLTPAGREVLEGCAAKRLVVRAVTPEGEPLARTSERLDRSVPQCWALANAARCEIIAAPGENCLFPWPSNHFTVRDDSTPTGRRVDLALESMPTNKNGVHVDPTELNRSDGFSPGVSIVTRVPGLDTPQAFRRTGAVPLTDMERAFDRRQPIVLIDAKTGKRQLIWSEIDANATSPKVTDLIIRVGRNLKEGRRYIVAMRGLKDASGDVLPAPPGFAVYRDDLKTDVARIEGRRRHFESIFRTLKEAGIHRGNLYGAWDFTVASTENITGRMLHIRDDGLRQLGDETPGDGVMQGQAPSFRITDVKTVNEPKPRPGHEDLKETDPEHAVQNVREVTGTFEVPCYLDQPGCVSGSRYNLGPDGLPRQLPGNTYRANFTCNIPRSAVRQRTPGSGTWDVFRQDRTSMYGHGLFGDAGEVHTENVRQLGYDEHVVTCAADWIGMAEEDIIPEALPALLDLSNFPALPDRLQQGFLDFIYLGRLMAMPDGFASSPAFRFGGESVIDTDKGVFYYGNSQGGIAGGALTAIEPDLTRSVLYVPGMNYSTLLTRSVDFEDYALVLYPSYPDEIARPLLLSLIQMEWDRGEPNGYANHMTDDPLPGTPPHKVLIEMAYADHQVSNVATAVEARTIGAPLRYPTLDPGRVPPQFVDFFPRLPELGSLQGQARHGNGFFVWDIGPKRPDGMGGFLGTAPAPITNTAPDDTFGVDPHDTVIDTSAAVRHQIAQFIRPHGKIVPACGHHPCYAAGWHGPGG